MTTSQTYQFGNQNFGPAFGAIGAYALRRVGVPRTSISVEHLEDVAMAANLVLSDWSTDQPNLWNVQINQFPLTQGLANYTLPTNVLLPLDFYVRTLQTPTFLLDPNGNLILTPEGAPIVTGTTGAGPPNDRILFGVSRTEYASYPNKTQQAPPNVVWVDRVQPIQVNIYQTPDGNGPYVLYYWAVMQPTDAVISGGVALDLPYRAFKAFTDALVAELSLTYKPDQAQAFAQVAMGSKTRLNTQDREIVPLYITPSLSRYYRT